ncbi:hypothetical protein EXS71_00810 [Candidatus Uhrbacteria bacterium]|nr:hypothetical protein [Candidatus Uhrbacteria bacterium]
MAIQTENSPIVITVPHDGETKVDGAPIRPQVQQWTRDYGGDHRDIGSRACAEACADHLREMGLPPTLIVFDLYRGQVDVNRGPNKEPFILPDEHGFGQAYENFHEAVSQTISLALEIFDRCLLIDLHSFTVPPPQRKIHDVVLGTNEGETCSLHISEQLCRSLGVRYRTGHSPDREQGISGRYRGGYIVRGTTKRFQMARDTDHFAAIQIEKHQNQTFLDHPEIFGHDLAQSLLILMGERS